MFNQCQKYIQTKFIKNYPFCSLLHLKWLKIYESRNIFLNILLINYSTSIWYKSTSKNKNYSKNTRDCQNALRWTVQYYMIKLHDVWILTFGLHTYGVKHEGPYARCVIKIGTILCAIFKILLFSLTLGVRNSNWKLYICPVRII